MTGEEPRGDADLQRRLGAGLFALVATVVALIVGTWIIGLLRDGSLPATTPRLSEIMPALSDGSTVGLVGVVLLLAFAIPALGVSLALALFAHRRQWAAAGLCALVLLVIAASVGAGVLVGG